MRNTSGKTRKERKAERKAKKQSWLETYPKYYSYKENVSAAGIVYYPTTVSEIVNPKKVQALHLGGVVLFEFLKSKLGI